MKRVTVFAPATIANIGPGFDILGVAIQQPGDFAIAEKTSAPGLHFTLKGQTSDLPTDNKNVAAYVAQLMLDTFKPAFGVALTLDKRMPIGSGLGSSGASAAASAFAINALLDKPLSKMDLIQFAVSGEKLASGSAHADNVAPSLLGGLCLIRSYQPLDVIQLPYTPHLYWVVVHPDLIIATKDARAQLPAMIPIAHALTQNGNLAGLITGLQSGNEALIARSLEDMIAEPVRSDLITGYHKIKQAALAAGAIGFSISGSGPSVFAIASNATLAKQIGLVIQHAFKEYANVNSQLYCSQINAKGTHILPEVT